MTATVETMVATQVHRVYIKATPQQVWDAITSPEWTERYGYRARQEFDLRPGGAFVAYANQGMRDYGAPDVVGEGEIIEADPPHKLVQTWRMLFDPAQMAEPMTRLTYEIVEEFGGSRLTVTHELENAPIHAALVQGDIPEAGGGWPFVLSDLKTLLETGRPLDR
jgi:uncharacterized protein YndB with AHSA1/START domain